MHLRDRGGRRGVPVELLRQALDRHHVIGVQEKQGQHGALVAAAERELGAVTAGLDGAEEAEVRRHGSTVAARKAIGSG